MEVVAGRRLRGGDAADPEQALRIGLELAERQFGDLDGFIGPELQRPLALGWPAAGAGDIGLQFDLIGIESIAQIAAESRAVDGNEVWHGGDLAM